MQKEAAGKSAENQSSSAAARYIATLSHELAQIARRHGLDGLAYILEMARLEADQTAKGSADASGRAA